MGMGAVAAILFFLGGGGAWLRVGADLLGVTWLNPRPTWSGSRTDSRVYVTAPARAGALEWQLGAKVVGLPVLDLGFDGALVGEVFVEDFARERGEFGIAGEAQSDELARAKV
jgi:hypothetical protein